MPLTFLNAGRLMIGLLLTILSGCAAVVPMASHTEDAAAKSLRPLTDKALLYIYRENGFVGRATSFPVSVNNHVVGWLGPGTYLALTFTPGTYLIGALGSRNTFNGFLGDAPVSKQYQATKGARTFLRLSPQAGIPLKVNLLEENESNSVTALSDLQLVRFDNNGTMLATLVNKRLDLFLPKKQESGDRTSSSEQSNNALQILGAVFLIGLFVLSAKSGAFQNYNPPIMPSSALTAEVRADLLTNRTQIRSDANTVPAAPPVLAPSFRANQEILRASGSKIYSSSSGTVWTVDGSEIKGNDGTRYKVEGSRIYSADGRAFQVVGNNIFGADGSSCQLVSNQLYCK